MKFNMKVLGISTSFPTLAGVPKSDDVDAETVDAGKTKTAVGWPSNWHQLSPRWRATLLRELVFKVLSSILQGDEKSFAEFKRLTGWGAEEVDSLKAQLATEREAHARTLAALVELSSYESRRHPPKMGGDHFPPSLRAVMKQVEAAIAAAKVTP